MDVIEHEIDALLDCVARNRRTPVTQEARVGVRIAILKLVETVPPSVRDEAIAAGMRAAVNPEHPLSGGVLDFLRSAIAAATMNAAGAGDQTTLPSQSAQTSPSFNARSSTTLAAATRPIDEPPISDDEHAQILRSIAEERALYGLRPAVAGASENREEAEG